MEYTIKSISFPQGAMRIFPSQVVETTAPADFQLDRALGGEAKYGKLHLREDILPIYEGWLAPKPILDCVPAEKSEGIMIPTQGREHIATITGTTVYDSVIKLNMRDVGKYISLQDNFREYIANYMKSSEGQKLSDLLNKSGFNAENIDYVAVGFIPDKAIYGVARLPDGKIVIKAHKDSYKKIADEAKYFGMEPEELRDVAIAEELTHIFRGLNHSNLITEETETKTTLKEFYEALSKSASDPNLKAKYERIIAHLEDDISTVSRYTKINSKDLQELVELYCTDMGELEQVLEAEAVERGLSGSDIKDYVSEKLDEVAEAVGDYESVQDESYSEAESVDAEAEACETAGEGEVCAAVEDGGGSQGGDADGGSGDNSGSSGDGEGGE